jgi:hypothetical protein
MAVGQIFKLFLLALLVLSFTHPQKISPPYQEYTSTCIMLGSEEDFPFFNQAGADPSVPKNSKKHTSDRTGMCPSCQRPNMKLDRTIDRRGIAVATCAFSAVASQLQAEWVGGDCDSQCFAVCSNCAKWSLTAIQFANNNLFKGEVASISDKGKVTKAKCLRSPIYGGSRTLSGMSNVITICLFLIIYILIKI